MRRSVLAGLVLLALTLPAIAAEDVFLASDPALSPDGKTLVFTWQGDLWAVATEGGRAKRLTSHPAADSDAFFSPDGREIAFVSERDVGAQVFVMPAEGGTPVQVTHDTNGVTLLGWTPDGEHFLVRMTTDREWRRPYRFFRIHRSERRAPEMLFDAWGYDARLSPDGRTLLFTREGVAWWRKGYRGAQAGQIWSYDLEKKSFTKLIHNETGALYPRWVPGENAFYYVDRAGDGGNLHRYDLATGEKTPITTFEKDGVVATTVSADGRTVVFRHLFDFYRMTPGQDGPPAKIGITVNGDRFRRVRERRLLKQATGVAFSKDGLEIAFVAGGDLFVMDTVLREPKQITKTPGDESSPIFTPDGKAILFLGARQGQGDVFRAERKVPEKWWWQNEEFTVTAVSEDPMHESGLSLSPDGKHMAFIRGRGDLVVRDVKSGAERVIVSAFERAGFDWSPDGKWIAWAVSDRDFNGDVWLAPVDGSREPVNVSMHPDRDWNPTFSPDGKLLAFLSRRRQEETDIHYVWLREEDADETKRDRKISEAVEKMKKSRKKPAGKKEAPKKGTPEEKEPGPTKPEIKPEPKKPDPKGYDLDRIQERVLSVSIRNVDESGLFWSPDGGKLAFSATIDGKRGVYTIGFPDELKPKLLMTTTGSGPQWVKEGNSIRWLVRGVPTVTTARGASTGYSFSVPQEVDVAARYAAAFDTAWRIMRDRFYDPRMNHRNWDAMRTKYRERASLAPDRATFDKVVDMMLGELNASHLGFSARSEPSTAPRDAWRIETGHLGLRWVDDYAGPGLRVLDVVRGGPADRGEDRVRAGEIVTAIDGVEVGPETDLTTVLNGLPSRDVEVTVENEKGEERTVTIRPTSLSSIRSLLYDVWLEDCGARVKEASGGTLGYLHIRMMAWSSFYEFERQLYVAGYGRDGLVIDVRNNGGGFTADHLLTALTQPVHAYTISRGGGPGYPQDRKVYATWNKPIVVLVNQNSFSNAEIFAHAIRNLGRGRLVGVRSAGGVISTGGARVMDIGFIRTPGRGWFLIGDGEDMELNGAVPHFEIWPEPMDTAMGIDRQLDKAIEVLLEDVAEWKKLERPKPKYRSDR